MSVRRQEPAGQYVSIARRKVTIIVPNMPEREITENVVEALGRALGWRLSAEDSAILATGLQATRQEMASLDSLDLNGVEPAIGFQPHPPARPQ